jgi:heat shock protein HtpX
MQKAAETSFAIKTETTEKHPTELAEFLYQKLVLPRKNWITNVQQTSFQDENMLSFRLTDPQGKGQFDTEIKVGKTVEVKITPTIETPLSNQIVSQLKNDVFIAVGSYEELMRRRTIYFAWVEGVKLTPEKSYLRRKRLLDKILFENMIFLFILLLIFSVFLFVLLEPIFGIYVPIVLVAVQFSVVLAAPKIIARGSDWMITKQNPNVHILMYKVPLEESKNFRGKIAKDTLMKIKIEIYQKTLALGKPIDCQVAAEAFAKYGLTCLPENLSVKAINVYRLVEEAARKFSLPIPKIVITNTVIPNAAATGPSPKLGTLLITTGILVQLREEELLAVLGHEFSHLTGRDPLLLFGLIAGEYLLRFYLVLPILFDYDILFFYVYFLFALGVIFFIAKFFEARADLVSAMRIGTPQILAGALRKIGFRRLGMERARSVRVQSWIGLDPHPPIYFRIDRLEKLQPPVHVKHPLLKSIKDCLYGFFASF